MHTVRNVRHGGMRGSVRMYGPRFNNPRHLGRMALAQQGARHGIDGWKRQTTGRGLVKR